MLQIANVNSALRPLVAMAPAYQWPLLMGSLELPEINDKIVILGGFNICALHNCALDGEYYYSEFSASPLPLGPYHSAYLFPHLYIRLWFR